jgi:threonine dehydrogenase-like Zn-dependent dehydrogenase
MGDVVVFTGPRAAEVRSEQDRPLAAGEVRVQTLYSGISAGTELTAYRGSNPYLNKTWDGDRRLFVDGGTSLSYPVEGWGYEECGRIVELGGEGEKLDAIGAADRLERAGEGRPSV